MAKKKAPAVDGMSPKLISRIRSACRDVWRYSTMRKLALARSALPGDFFRCETCQKKVPKVFVDHVEAVGKVDGGFLERMFVPSTGLQILCGLCHKQKTKQEREEAKW